jgi:hypothetical protein
MGRQTGCLRCRLEHPKKRGAVELTAFSACEQRLGRVRPTLSEPGAERQNFVEQRLSQMAI